MALILSMKYLSPELVGIIRQYAGVRPNVLTRYKQVLEQLIIYEKFTFTKTRLDCLWVIQNRNTYFSDPEEYQPKGFADLSRCSAMSITLTLPNLNLRL